MNYLRAVLTASCLAAGLCAGLGHSALAGPVERELVERGGDVGFPKPRPQRAVDRASPATKIPNNLDDPVSKISQRKAPEITAKAPPSNEIGEAQVPQAAASGCLAELRRIALAEPARSPDTDDPACLIPEPVNLKQTISRYPVKFTKGLTLDCPFALSLARFTNNTVQALARHHLGTTIDAVVSGEGFVCRRRNNAPTGKLSEHAFGNATDWVGFRFANDSRLSIKAADLLDADEAGFLNSVRSAACGAFTTVLGPGANAAHATHFHFDLGRSKGKKNPYRICE